MSKRCPDCGETKSRAEFYRNRAKLDGLAVQCKACDSARRRKHREANLERERARDYERYHRGPDRRLAIMRARRRDPEAVRAYQREYYAGIRRQIVALLGARCARCGTASTLEIDHIYEDGAEHRRQRGTRSNTSTVLRDILNSIEAGEVRHQLLCARHHREKSRAARSA